LIKLTAIFFCILTYSNCIGQSNSDTIKKNYCGSALPCPIGKDDPIHFDPYYNGHLCENFNPEQTDFSKEYFELQTRKYAKDTNLLRQSLKYDFSQIFLSDNWEQNGVLGLNYQRIQLYIDKVSKSNKKRDIYLIKGKSKIGDNICNFSGQLLLLKVFFFDSSDDKSKKKCGELFGRYILFGDSLQNHSGIFKGVFECSIYIDSTGKKMLLDNTYAGADGYWNRTFVGTWTEYKNNNTKKCIWGDDRLPFTFDFDCGDGEMRVCDKYKMNGWQNFNDHSETIEVSKNKFELKNKWWLTK
jgi:hypothetical protein